MQHFDAGATAAALPYPALVAALRDMFIDGDSVYTAPPRHVHPIAAADGSPAGTMLLMPAWRAGHFIGLKAVNVFPANAQRALPALHAVYTLFDANTGVPLAQIDGMALTTRRTAAASALAATYLARSDATQLLVVGAGRVAAELPFAMRAALPQLQRFGVWARKPTAALDLAARWCVAGLDAFVCSDLAAGVRDAHIVSCATLATAPLVRGAWLTPGTHLGLIGAFTPQMRESDAECFARGRIFVDSEDAMAKAGDVLQAISEGAFVAAHLQATLAQLCRSERAGRGSAAEITIFKSVGHALQDLAAAELVVRGG